jgi:hypothetical protein
VTRRDGPEVAAVERDEEVGAEDEVAAAKVITGVTGRVGRYAVLEVTIVDLGAPDPYGTDLVAQIGDLPHRAP